MFVESEKYQKSVAWSISTQTCSCLTFLNNDNGSRRKVLMSGYRLLVMSCNFHCTMDFSPSFNPLTTKCDQEKPKNESEKLKNESRRESCLIDVGDWAACAMNDDGTTRIESFAAVRIYFIFYFVVFNLKIFTFKKVAHSVGNSRSRRR